MLSFTARWPAVSHQENTIIEVAPILVGLHGSLTVVDGDSFVMAKERLSVWKPDARHSSGINCYISHSSRDGALYARALGRVLVRHGHSVVLSPDDVDRGQQWAKNLQQILSEANVQILVATPAILVSRWTEWESNFFYSRRQGHRIIPIMFRELSRREQIPPWLMEILWIQEEKAALVEGPSPRVIENLLNALNGMEQPGLPFPKSKRLEKTRPLNEGKLILVGRGEVGKTSLVRRLLSNEFRSDESKTQGINITTWSISHGSDVFQLNTWDFGGQEIMHATHQFFLTERSLYLLVLNGREGGEDSDAEYWLKHVETFGAESPVIIVLNKIAQHPFELNYRGLRARYPQIRGFVRTDCKDASGLDDLRKMVTKIVAEMPEMRMQFPTDWFAVKERLESMESEYMGYDSFRELCAEEGIEDESDRDTLSFALHCLGIALNYREDPRLRETSVLKPEWITEGIYTILNAKKIAERQGELHLNDLQQLLPRKRYPFDKHFFLLELMRKFSLCFPFPDEMDRYLIPELLGKEEPSETSKFKPRDCLNFEYYYGVLPEGLIPRFIVRSHTLSHGQERWRSGVILAHEDCKALVTTQPSERRVVIRVKGQDPGSKRRLLAIIRYDLDRINMEFKDRLDAQTKVPLTDFPEFAVDYKKLVAFEKQGVKTFPEFIGDQVIMVDVQELLNGVDLDKQRKESPDVIVKTKTVFFSYSHKDEALRDELETHLKLLQRQGVISTWHDRKILPGTEWDREIDIHLERANIILLLVSADFIASDYCWDNEVKRALERHTMREARAVPVLLRSCDWKHAPFGKLQVLPTGVEAVTSWQDRDAAWTNVATGIRTIVEEQDKAPVSQA